MKNTYLFSGIFQTDRPLENSELDALRHAICAQIEEPVDLDGNRIRTKIDLETITMIPFTDKVEIVVNPDSLDKV
jgi:hypothetical protein